MRAPAPGERRILLVFGALSVAVPALAAHHLSRTLEDRVGAVLSDRLGVPVSIDSVDASLLGSVRFANVRVGDVLELGAIEVSASPAHLMSGQLIASELRLEHPRIRTEMTGDGGSNIEPLIRRLRVNAPASQSSDRSSLPRSALKRIIVTGGQLVIELADRGTLSLHGVELRPQHGGLRATATRVRAHLHGGGVAIQGDFRRAAADIELPSLATGRPAISLRRVIASLGQFQIDSGGPPLRLAKAVFTHGIREQNGLYITAVPAGSNSAAVDVALSRADDGIAVDVHARSLPLAAFGPLAPTWLDLSRADASGALHAVVSDRTWVDIDARTRGISVSHPQLAAHPVPFAARLRGRLDHRVVGDRRTISLSAGVIDWGRVELRTDAQLELADSSGSVRRGSARITLPRSGCDDVLAAIPPTMRDRLDGLDARGTIAGSVDVTIDLSDPEATRLAVDIDADGCDVVRESAVADPRSLIGHLSHRLADGSRRELSTTDPDWVRLDTLPDHVFGAWVAAEDARFWKHRGFDVQQIERSLAINVGERRLVRGGSTISQQLVKNVFLQPDRTFARKLQEALLTWRIEQALTKRQILERYLNLIELGENIYGIRSAARHWFDTTPERLKVPEVAFLAALTPAPATMSRAHRDRSLLDEFASRRVQVILGAMRSSGVISHSRYERARRSRVILKHRHRTARLLP